MLDIAYNHKEALQREYARAIFKPENFYYFSAPYHGYELKIDNDSWENLQFVSVTQTVDTYLEINGYFCANISRSTNHVTNMQLIKFKDNISHDLVRFLRNLFEKYQFRKIEWFVVIGNPAEKMYDRIIDAWGGRVVGIFREHVRLIDNKLYDIKYYEIFKSAYDARIDKGG